jgi:hypothetical protein
MAEAVFEKYRTLHLNIWMRQLPAVTQTAAEKTGQR